MSDPTREFHRLNETDDTVNNDEAVEEAGLVSALTSYTWVTLSTAWNTAKQPYNWVTGTNEELTAPIVGQETASHVASSVGASCDTSGIPISVLVAGSGSDKPLSELFFNRMGHLEGKVHGLSTDPLCVAFRVGADSAWTVVDCDEGKVVSSKVVSEPPQSCAAQVTYSNEPVFCSMMDDELTPTVAFMLGKLKVWGSIGAASAAEPLYVAAEAIIRDCLRTESVASAVAAAAAATMRARAEQAAAEEQEQLVRLAARGCFRRNLLRHLGTNQQVAAWLITVGSTLYVYYTADQMYVKAPADLVANGAFLLSAIMWLGGSFGLVLCSYPEAMLKIVDLATVDAVDSTRIEEMGWVDRYLTASALLLSSWALGVGAPTFLTGAVLALLAHLDDTMLLVVNSIYVFAGVYIIMATGFMVMGALPQNLAQNGGMGSTYIRDALGRGKFLDTHAVNDMVAGTWMFTAFMVACVIFAAVDLALEPSMLAVWFLASQVPFGSGFVILARASYPESINISSMFDAQDVIDEMVRAGHGGEMGPVASESRRSFYHDALDYCPSPSACKDETLDDIQSLP